MRPRPSATGCATPSSSPTAPTSCRRMGRTLGTGGFHRPSQHVGGRRHYEAPYGNTLVGAYAMAARRHMHEYGTTSEQLAEIAVGVREYAGLNPDAMYRDPITVDDVVNSRVVADPLHKLDCCVISDGGGAVIMTTAERARDLRQPPVYVLGSAGGETHWNISQMPDFTTTAAARCGPEAFARAGVTTERRRHDPVLRQLHDHRAPAARGPRLLQEGRGRPVRRRGPPAARRRPAAQHRRRGPVLVPLRHARDLPAHRGDAPARGTRPAWPRSPTARSPSPAAPGVGCRRSAPSYWGGRHRERATPAPERPGAAGSVPRPAESGLR